MMDVTQLKEYLLDESQHSIAFEAIGTMSPNSSLIVYQECHMQLFQCLRLYEKRYIQNQSLYSTVLEQLFLAIQRSVVFEDKTVNDWIERYGGPFVQIILNLLLHHKTDTKLKSLAANTLTLCASRNDTCRIHIRELRGFKPILEMIKNSNDIVVKQYAMNLLGVILLNDMNRSCVPDLDGINIVLSLLKRQENSSSSSSSGSDDDDELIHSSLCVLNIFTLDSHNIQTIADQYSIVMDSILRLLLNTSSEMSH
jgi:hypothetical protein